MALKFREILNRPFWRIFENFAATGRRIRLRLRLSVDLAFYTSEIRKRERRKNRFDLRGAKWAEKDGEGMALVDKNGEGTNARTSAGGCYSGRPLQKRANARNIEKDCDGGFQVD